MKVQYKPLIDFEKKFDAQFGAGELDEFIDSIIDIPILVSYTYNLPRRSQRYQPGLKFFRNIVHERGMDTGRPTAPKGYELWLDILEDATGDNYFAFYPLKPKKGKLITVLYKGVNFDFSIDWTHGEPGLFNDRIYPLLFLESFIYSENRKVVDWILKNN